MRLPRVRKAGGSRVETRGGRRRNVQISLAVCFACISSERRSAPGSGIRKTHLPVSTREFLEFALQHLLSYLSSVRSRRSGCRRSRIWNGVVDSPLKLRHASLVLALCALKDELQARVLLLQGLDLLEWWTLGQLSLQRLYLDL